MNLEKVNWIKILNLIVDIVGLIIAIIGLFT